MEKKDYLDLFRKALTSRKLKFTRQREVIIDVIFRGEKHLTLDQILDEARAHHPGIGYATVYRTMKLMVECDLVDEHKFTDGQARYERVSNHHHDHMICVTCGKIVEFEDDLIERRQELLAEQMGFEVVDHRHEVYVRCKSPPCTKP
jgi:Fur family ferric uptake transcriptional regulator